MHLVPVQKHRAPTEQIAFKPTVFSQATKANSLEGETGKNQLPSRVTFFVVGMGSSLPDG